jgi:hypothetical protein
VSKSGLKHVHETHGTTFELVRHFMARMFDGEWSATAGQWQTVAVSTFALLLPAGVLLVRAGSIDQDRYLRLSALASAEPFRAAALADELALLTLVFAVTALVAAIQWQSLFPTRRDYMALAGLPVRAGQVFAARFASVFILSTALVVAMNFLPSVVAPLAYGGHWQKNPSLLVNIRAQAEAASLGCFFVLFAIVALQGVLLNALPARWFVRISAYVQAVLIGGALLAGLFSWSIRDWPSDRIGKLSQFGAWAPPVWFAGLHERLLGDPHPFFAAMACRSLTPLGAAIALAILGYVACYRRYQTLLVEAPVQTATSAARPWSVLRLWARKPQQQAIIEFMALTLARSRAQRVMWLAYVGAAIGIVINSSLIDARFAGHAPGTHSVLDFLVLYWPLGTAVVLISGFRHVLRIPAELPANWIFRLTENLGRKEWMSVVERFIILYAIAPVYLLIFPLAVYALGWPLALRMTSLQVLLSLTLFEMLFYSWQQLPFTCSYTPGKRPLILILGGYLGVLGMIVPVISLWVRAGSEFIELFPVYLVFFGGIWIWARMRRRDGWGDAKLLYEDAPEGVQDLGIHELTWRGHAVE